MHFSHVTNFPQIFLMTKLIFRSFANNVLLARYIFAMKRVLMFLFSLVCYFHLKRFLKFF